MTVMTESISALTLAELGRYESQDLVETKVQGLVQRAVVEAVMEQDAELERFMVSGAMLRDLSLVQHEPQLLRLGAFGHDALIIGVQLEWRIR